MSQGTGFYHTNRAPMVQGFTLETVPDYGWLKQISTGLVLIIVMVVAAMVSGVVVVAIASASGGEMEPMTMALVNLVIGLLMTVIGCISTWFLTATEKREIPPNLRIYSLGVRITYVAGVVFNLASQGLAVVQAGQLEAGQAAAQPFSGANPVLMVVTIISSIVGLVGFVFWILYFYNLLKRLEFHGLAKQYLISMLGMIISGVLILILMVIIAAMASSGGRPEPGLMMLPCCGSVLVLGFGIYALVIFIMMCVKIFGLTANVADIHSQLVLMQNQTQQQVASVPGQDLTAPITPGYPSSDPPGNPPRY